MRVFSGIQPTGIVHLGNYFGALINWIKLQNEGHECFYSIVNQHAITLPQDSQALSNSTLDVAAILLSIGLDPEKSTIFVQSDVPAHTQLAWILSCLSPIGELERMIQFKEKSEKNPSAVNIGLLTYPILMAADIMLYKADLVPVGIDQEQHLELTRMLVRKFNNKYGLDFFKEPKTLNAKTTKVVGLDGSSKMSKSANNFIGLIEDEKILWEKISPAVTDPARIRKTDPGNPNICNIYSLHSLFSNEQELNWVQYGCKNAKIGCIECKKKLFENIKKTLNPIREKYLDLIKKPDEIRNILKKGAQKANNFANKNLENIYKIIGFKY